MAAFHKQASDLLTEHLPRPFDLTLLNVGVTNLHPHGVPTGPASLPSIFGRAATPPGAGSGGTPAAAGSEEAGVDSGESGAAKRCATEQAPGERCAEACAPLLRF